CRSRESWCELAALVDMVSWMTLEAVVGCRGSKRGRGGFRERVINSVSAPPFGFEYYSANL
ncbi:hypothetical protein M413DRAFT_440792, partial [Hebeloma cylindrosporum]